MARLRIARMLAVLALVACSPAPPSAAPPSGRTATEQPVSSTPSPAPSPTGDREAGWRSDLAALIPAMDRIHPNLNHGVSREALDGAVEDMLATVPGATDDELLAGVLRVVAMVSSEGCDAHTGAFIWGTGTYPLESLPLRLWLFPDEQGGDHVVIVDALPSYEDLIGARIDAIGAAPIADVLERLDPLIPRDNDQTVRLLTPRYLLIPQVLRGLGLIDAGPDVTISVTKAGLAPSAAVAPIPMAEYNAWAGPYGLHLPADSDVLYLSRIDDALWWTRLIDSETLYVQWNRVDHLPLGTVGDLRDELHRSDVTRIVLDMRHNYGGEVSAVDPMLELFSDPAVDQPGKLSVITGRNTFSAASLFVARLDADSEATIVGEPMAGCPTSYGNPEELTLPFSGIVVSVADMLEVGVSADDRRPTIEPDIAVPLYASEWLQGSDPALGSVTTVVP